MKRITRNRRLTVEEAAKYQKIREQVAEELPDLMARHHERMRDTTMTNGQHQKRPNIPSVSVNYPGDGTSTLANVMGMRPMQERVWQRRGEQYLLIKSPPASGKSRALMFVALDKLYPPRIETSHHHRAGKDHRCQFRRHTPK